MSSDWCGARFRDDSGFLSGRIIALMLGRLRMSVDDAIKCYENLSKKIFSDMKWVGDGKYKATRLQNAIKDIVKEKVGDPEAPLFDDGSRSRVCKTYVHKSMASSKICPTFIQICVCHECTRYERKNSSHVSHIRVS